MKTVALVVGGLGLVGFGVGTALAFSAKSKFNDSSAYCHGSRCTQQGVDLRDDALSGASTATIVGGIGLAALAGGVVLYLTAPSAKGESKTAAPSIALGPGTITMGGTW